MNKINHCIRLIHFLFVHFGEINKHNQLSTFFKVCMWIVRAPTVINLILKNCMNRLEQSFTIMMKWLANISNKHVHLLSFKKHCVRESKIVPHLIYFQTAFTVYFQQANSCTFIEKVDCNRWNTSWSKAPMKKQKMNKVKTRVYLIRFILIDMWARNGALHILGGLSINH